MQRDSVLLIAAQGWAASLAALVLLASPCGAEEADESAVQRARELFREGVALSDQEQWEAAAERFEQALELRDAPAIRYNLAATLVQLRRDLEAVENLEAVVESSASTEELRAQSRTLLAELEPRLGTLSVRTEGLEDATLTLDGEALAADQLGNPVRVSAGPHVVAAVLEGEEVAREEVRVAEGGSESVTLTYRPPIEDSIIEAVEEPVEQPSGTPLIRDWRLWVGVGVGAAVVVTAVVVGIAVGVGGGIEDPIRGNMDPGVLTWR